jgi:hypothetical protein
LWEKVNRNCNEKVDFDRIGTQWLWILKPNSHKARDS